MRKRYVVVLVAVVMLCVGAMGASAQLRLDGNLSWPFYLGINIEGLTSGVQGSTDISKFAFLFPEVQLSWQFGDGALRGGVGLRAFTLIIESFGWPDAWLELELKPLVLRADLGGGWFYAFGLANSSATASVILPQLDLSWKLADWFRLGAGALLIAPFDNPSNFGVALYVGGRFTALFK
jgi:hypothetical protein